MNMEKVVISLYRKIAIDIAENIVKGKYAQGEKLYGRSVLASYYKVSPETIRKAVFLLKDMGIVDTEKGSGIEVISKQKAEEFIERNNSFENLSSIKKEIELWAKDQADQASAILNKIQYVINETERINAVSPLNPFQIKINADCKAVGKTGDKLILSPGPYATFCVDDIFFVGCRKGGVL